MKAFNKRNRPKNTTKKTIKLCPENGYALYQFHLSTKRVSEGEVNSPAYHTGIRRGL